MSFESEIGERIELIKRQPSPKQVAAAERRAAIAAQLNQETRSSSARKRALQIGRSAIALLEDAKVPRHTVWDMRAVGPAKTVTESHASMSGSWTNKRKVKPTALEPSGHGWKLLKQASPDGPLHDEKYALMANGQVKFYERSAWSGYSHPTRGKIDIRGIIETTEFKDAETHLRFMESDLFMNAVAHLIVHKSPLDE